MNENHPVVYVVTDPQPRDGEVQLILCRVVAPSDCTHIVVSREEWEKVSGWNCPRHRRGDLLKENERLCVALREIMETTAFDSADADVREIARQALDTDD